MENVICQGFSNCVPGFHENIMVSEAKGKKIKLKKIECSQFSIARALPPDQAF